VEKYRRIVFCDFDGTITVEETLVGMLKLFARAHYQEIEDRIIARSLTIREGLRRLVESIPSERYPEMLGYIRDKEMRPGFEALLDFLREEGVPFVVISGGLRGAVCCRLECMAERIHAIYAADVNTEGKYLRVLSDFEGDTELVAKARIMVNYACDESVAIGDGISDMNMALQSSLVFARDSLCGHLEARGKPYKPWNDFYDIRDCLALRWRSLDSAL